MPISDAVQGYLATEASNLGTIALYRNARVVVIEDLDTNTLYIKQDQRFKKYPSRGIDMDMTAIKRRLFTVERLVLVGAMAEVMALRLNSQVGTRGAVAGAIAG